MLFLDASAMQSICILNTVGVFLHTPPSTVILQLESVQLFH